MACYPGTDTQRLAKAIITMEVEPPGRDTPIPGKGYKQQYKVITNKLFV